MARKKYHLFVQDKSIFLLGKWLFIVACLISKDPGKSQQRLAQLAHKIWELPVQRPDKVETPIF